MNEKQMQEMAVSVLLDEYTQLDVAQLLKEYEEAEEKEELPNVPRTLDKRCSEIIKREFIKKNQKKRFVRISKALSRVAVITLMLIGLGTVSVLSVKAWREPVLRLVLETFDRYTTVGMEGEGSQGSKTPEDVIEKLSEVMPPDYKLVYKRVQQGRCLLRYIGQNGEIVNLIASTYRHGFYFDTESTDGTQHQVNGYDVILVNKNGLKALCLNEGQELLIELSTVNISEKTFWNIVQKITK